MTRADDPQRCRTCGKEACAATAEYEAARKAADEASAQFRKVQEDYRARTIGDGKYLAAHAAYKLASDAFDAAYSKAFVQYAADREACVPLLAEMAATAGLGADFMFYPAVALDWFRGYREAYRKLRAAAEAALNEPGARTAATLEDALEACRKADPR